MRITSISLVLLFLALGATAQTLTMGNVLATVNSSDLAIAATRTDVDLGNPANATGNVTSAEFHWSALGCTNAVKIKFFRRSGDSLTMTAERGPFSVTTFDSTLAMSPPVPVQQGDLIGIARVASCGNAGALVGIVTPGFLVFPSDVTGTVAFSSGTRGSGVLSVSGSGTATEITTSVLPVVGSTAGSFGANFKTSLQLVNGFTSGSPMTGRFVLRKQGVPGSSSDPSVDFSVPANSVVTYPDILLPFSYTGLGSIDVVVPFGAAVPVIVTRVFNDAGTAGTAGLTEDPVRPNEGIGGGSRAPSAGATAVMVTPSEPARTRFNIGVRSLFAGASLTAVLKNPDGTIVTSVTKTYQPNFFQQVSAESFFGGVSINANQIVVISVSDGSAIIYGSTTDNVTNDPALQYAITIFAIA